MISNATLLDWMKADAADTALLRILEQAAIKAAEKITGRYLGVTTAITETIRFKNWPLPLANEPIGGAITSLSQWNGSAYGVVPAADYYVDGSLIHSNASYIAPVTDSPLRFQAVYQAGYTVDGADANIWAAPKDIQIAVLLLVGHWYENRESVIVGTSAVEVPMTVQAILSPHQRVVV